MSVYMHVKSWISQEPVQRSAWQCAGRDMLLFLLDILQCSRQGKCTVHGSLPVMCCRLNAGTPKDSGRACLGSRLTVSSALPLLPRPQSSLHHGFKLRMDPGSALDFHAELSMAAAWLAPYGCGCHCESSSLHERNLQHSYEGSKSLVTCQSLAEQLSWCEFSVSKPEDRSKEDYLCRRLTDTRASIKPLMTCTVLAAVRL